MVQEIDSIIHHGDAEDSDCVLLSAPYDRTSCMLKGSKDGCREIVKCLSYKIEFLDRLTLTEPGYLFKIANEEIPLTNQMLPEEMVEAVSLIHGRHFDEKFVVLLGGDHSVSIGAFKSIAARRDPQRITVLAIDAHCDLREDDSDSNPDRSCISRFSHASVMRRAFEMGFPLVLVGVRSFSKQEHEYFSGQERITVFQWGAKPPTVEQVIDAVKTEDVYLSLDVDGIDPAHLPATGAPVPGGLEWYYAEMLLRTLAREKNMVAADIVEVIPREQDLLTPMGAARLAYTIIGERLQRIRKR